MNSRKPTLEEIIEATVSAAQQACLDGIDKKIEEAVSLGVKIGAVAGAEAGAVAATRAIERERKRLRSQQHDKRLRNTKLLLQNYRALNEHYKHAVFDVQTAEEESDEFADIIKLMNATMLDEDLYIESIKQSCVRTKVIMAHVNTMLDIYQIMCEHSKRDDIRRHWRTLESMYLSDEPMTAMAVAERENIDKRTVYKDLDASIAVLTTLFFGVAGLDKQ